MFKKGYSSFLAVIFSLVLMFGVTACSSDDTSSEPANNEPVAGESTPEPEVVVEVEECDEDQVLQDEAVAYFNEVSQSGVNMMKADEFKSQFELSGDTLAVLDIRKPEDFAAGHLEGAINIPMGAIGQRIAEIPTDKEIAVICYSGQTASQTTGVLRMAGYNAKVITGGFPAIEKAEFEIVN